MDKKRLPKVFKIQASIYLITILGLSITLLFFNSIAGIIGLCVFLLLGVFNITSNIKRHKAIIKYIENLTFNIDTATKDTLINFPMPLVVSELNGDIIWHNSSFRQMFKTNQELEDSVDSFIKDIGVLVQNNKTTKISKPVVINGTDYYNMYGNIIKLPDKDIDEYMALLYFVDTNDYVSLNNKYDDEKNITSIIIIDNYDDLMQSLPDGDRPNLLSEIDKCINKSLSFTSGIIRKFERDKYLFIFQKKYLELLKNKNFEILDLIKEINAGNRIPVTISLGIGMSEETPIENFNGARISIDMALGRGGDQVAIKNKEEFTYFGGKTMEVEKRTKVKARVIAMALNELIDHSSNVIIMGHKNTDMDCIGSALGLYRAIKNRNKNAYYIVKDSNPNVDKLIEQIKEANDHEDVFIQENQAKELIDNKTLLIIVDTYRESLVEAPGILPIINRKVVFDHHRKGEDFIKDTIITYHETYASSTSELVSEVLQYMESKIILKRLEAEAMLAGIIVDTKNFTVKTGVRTFEAAAFLRRQNIDTSSVKKLLQNSIIVYNGISDVVSRVEIIEGIIAISDYSKIDNNSILIAAKASDELLNIENIEASFVLCYGIDCIYISGRSYGKINVQVILEKLGGGGHMSVAAAQIDVPTLEEAKELLKDKIVDYFNVNRINSEV